MSNHTEITVRHAEYVDPRAGNDKFYRTFVFGSSWVTQYGKNGSVGTVTKVVQEASPEAAQAAADKKFDSKVKKGYSPVRQGTVVFDGEVTPENIHVLDAIAGQVGEDTSHDSGPVAVAEVTQTLPDATAAVAEALAEVVLVGRSRDAVDTDTAPDLPTRPMLASVVPAEKIAELMDDENWVAQMKYDGDRVVIEVRDGVVTALNRQGQAKVRNVGTAHTTPFTALGSGRWVFDGEVVGRTLVLFDTVAASDGQTTWVDEASVFEDRMAVLVAVASTLGLDDDEAFVVAPVADDRVLAGSKGQMLADAVAGQREGIILRDRYGVYEPGRRSTLLVKHKLIKDADAVVTALHETKQSATLSVHDEDGSLREVGAASTIGKGTVSVGDVWVVTFLYVTDPANPRMFQPRLVARREDKAASECGIAQFADAGTDKAL